MELSLDREGQVSVDGVLCARPVLSLCIIVDVHGALSTFIAVVVNSILWQVALVAGRMEGPLVCLLNVELRAPMSTYLVGITVSEIVAIVGSRHKNGVQGGDAATANIAEVDSVFEGAAEEVWPVVLGLVESWRFGQVHSIVEAVA